jgi:hypothetical protein
LSVHRAAGLGATSEISHLNLRHAHVTAKLFELCNRVMMMGAASLIPAHDHTVTFVFEHPNMLQARGTSRPGLLMKLTIKE